MGAANSSERQLPPPQNIAEFRKLTNPADNYVIPEVPEKRRTTDSKFTIVLAVCLVILVPFLTYTSVYSDMDRFIPKYDECGNVCGKKNSYVDGIECSGQDRTNEPLLQYKKNPWASSFDEDVNELVPDKCVDECDRNFQEIFNVICVPTDDQTRAGFINALSIVLNEISYDINKSLGYMVVLTLIGFGLCIGMLYLFRYFVAVVVWIILCGSLLAIITLTIIFWYFDGIQDIDYPSRPFRVIAIVFSVVSLVLTILIICMFKRIQLVIRLFREAIKVIFEIPLILLEPLLTLVARSILGFIFIYFLILLGTAGTLQQTKPSLYEYVPNLSMIFTLWYHMIMCLWMTQFIIGCQHMVISGSISTYYFARDKSTVGSPIYRSFYNLVRYHLGTVAIGSLIITTVAIIKAMIRSLTNNKHAKFLVYCCLGRIEDLLKYLSKNAYIQTAMHGQPFYKSGKRAVRLLFANALSTIAVNSVGDFILGMSKLTIVICTALIGALMWNATGITHFWAAIVISTLLTAIIADCLFAVFETAIDTIFICFCEDSCLNDGMARPYYMSVNLMKYVEDAKATVKQKNSTAHVV